MSPLPPRHSWPSHDVTLKAKPQTECQSCQGKTGLGSRDGTGKDEQINPGNTGISREGRRMDGVAWVGRGFIGFLFLLEELWAMGAAGIWAWQEPGSAGARRCGVNR